MDKTYSSKSNANRAAKAAGLEAKVIAVPAGDRFALKALPEFVALATEHADLGILPADTAESNAQEVANETGETVHLRDTTTDEVISSVKPSKPKTPQVPAIAGMTPLGVTPPTGEAPAVDMTETKNGMPAALDRIGDMTTEEIAATREAATTKNRSKEPTMKNAAIKNTNRPAASKPSNGKATARRAVAQPGRKSAKPTKAGAARTPRKRDNSAGPTGKTAEVIKLALRAKGVTPKELIDLTGWEKAPWKWNFQNPKGTGYADRFGFRFSVDKSDGETRYKLTPKG